MDLEIVRLCIQHLLYYKVVALIDIFQYSNIYSANKTITKLAFDKGLQQRCLQYEKQRSSTIVEEVKVKPQCEDEDFDMCINNEPPPEA